MATWQCKWCALKECWDHPNQDGINKDGTTGGPQQWDNNGGFGDAHFEYGEDGITPNAVYSMGWDVPGGWGDKKKNLDKEKWKFDEEKKNPWSYIEVGDDDDTLGLGALSCEIPYDWIAWQHGGIKAPEAMKSLLFMDMTGAGHRERLEQLVGEASAIELSIHKLVLTKQEKIRDAEIYCLAVGLESTALRSLIEGWLAHVTQDQRSRHVPYDAEGYVKIAYIRGEVKADAEQFVKKHAQELEKKARRLSVEHISYDDAAGNVTQIPLGIERPRKVARTEREEEEGDPEASPEPLPVEQRTFELVGAKQIDGSVLEGGGQILRTALTYSALFGFNVQVSRIRAGRAKPGLTAQHLESLHLIRDVSTGRLLGDEIGSSSVGFVPGKLELGHFEADPSVAGLGSAGAITLMIQAAMFPLVFAGGTCKLNGGTDVGLSPPLDFFGKVLLPSLWNMGVSCSVDLRNRGFDPQGGGEVVLHIQPLEGSLLPLTMTERGEVKSAEACLYATETLESVDEDASVSAVSEKLGSLAPELDVKFFTAPTIESTFKIWVDIIIEMTTGCRFHAHTEPKELTEPVEIGGSELPELFTAATEKAMQSLREQLNTGAAVDSHLLDQLILPASLAAGRSSFLAAEPSLHTRTAMHIAELLVPGFRFREEKQEELSLIIIEGVGYTRAGASAATGAKEAVEEKLSEDFDFD